MSTSYWAQWSHAELMSMHGIEIEDEKDEDIAEKEEEMFEESASCCSLGCMKCLGFSWKDFM